MLTKPLVQLIEQNESLTKMKDRMIEREGKSTETLRRYIEGIQSFCKYMKATSPDQALEMLRASSDITATLDGYIDYLIKVGFKPVNMKAHFFGVKKWLAVNRVNGVDWSYISKPKVSTMIKDRIPTKVELSRILTNKISLRDQAFFTVSLASGLRIGTLSNLKLKDYKPIEELGLITVEGGPNRKLPIGKSYFTFITPEARKLLDEYLATRKNLLPGSPLFAKEDGQPLSPYVTNITRQWHRLLTRANLDKKVENHAYLELHGHTLRKYFQTNCKLAGCRADFVDFWMGHHPARQDEYLNDSYFRPEIQSHIAEYRKAVSALQLSETVQFEKAMTEKDREITSLKERINATEGKLAEIEKLLEEIVKDQNA
jgi:integrase